ncbi:DJ-1/PfpI family protein [Micromonospora sp. WMMD1102]|uniref:DJ-1/PfpI family protein n=1 Tax=Micromonospora sp. WMMD1102 TaxID=3016105 RepID=UPI0032427F7C
MHVAIPLYPRFTALDVVGPYTVLAFAPGVTVTLVAAEPGPVLDDRGTMAISATVGYAELPRPDVVVVPGGAGTRAALADTALVSWIARAHAHTRWTTSVCVGSFLLGAAVPGGGRPATGAGSTSSGPSGPSRSGSGWSGTTGSSRRPVSRPA